jgi:hypothetical protein
VEVAHSQYWLVFVGRGRMDLFSRNDRNLAQMKSETSMSGMFGRWLSLQVGTE